MKLKKSRFWSFYVVGLAYIIAFIAAFASYKFLPLANAYLKILVADVIATVVIFVFSVAFKNASVYDPYWSVQPIVIVIALCFTGHKLTVARILPLIAVCLWGVRLTANWAYTFKNLLHEDWRYVMLKEKTGVFYPLVNFLGIHMFPTLVVYACMTPVIYTFTHYVNANAGSVIFFALSVLATVLQGVSDFQLHSFKRHGGTGFIRGGLWKHSRHPNYLGEILMWWGIALALISAKPEVWYFAFGALANTVMFLSFSIPVADRKQSKKQGFEEYKNQTRILLPIKKF